MELRIDQQARGVRIISGEEAIERRKLLNALIDIATRAGFDEIILPSLEPAAMYIDKAGPEVLGQMYNFADKKGRDLCLRPEGTATIQALADKHFKNRSDVKLWYFERCWRYERPQRGRYREFFQFGLEIINPSSESVKSDLIEIAQQMVSLKTSDFQLSTAVNRGLAYYTSEGFEISVASLGSQAQVLGGGAYKQGIGFAVGFDRLMLCG